MSCATPSALIPIALNPGLTAGAMVCRLFEVPLLRGCAVLFFSCPSGGGSIFQWVQCLHTNKLISMTHP